MSDEKRGHVVPRLYTPPLREISPTTSNGDAFILFCKAYLGVELYPWQKWLARHAMELNSDGTHRYRRIIVLVGRQNGKTRFASCLTAWWLFVESNSEPAIDRHAIRDPHDFVITGEAQNMKTALRPYTWLVDRCDPDIKQADASLRVPELVNLTRKVVKKNGDDHIVAKNGAVYEIRAGGSTRGTPAARVLMDEVREQHNWDDWVSTSQTTRSFVNGQLWAISSAGDARSVVLNHIRGEGLEQFRLSTEYGDGYLEADGADPTIGLFEWSAPDDAKPLDEEAMLAANPSIGWSGITLATCRSDYRSMPEHRYRAEVLCQYVPAKTTPYIDPHDYEACLVKEGSYKVAKGARTVWAVDTSADRRYTSIAGAVMCEDGIPLVALVREPRMSMLPVPDEMAALADESGQREVMIQERGCPAMEFAQPFEDRGLTVRRVPGSWFGIATGRLRDAIRDKRVRFLEGQESVALAVSGGITRRYGETDAWDRRASAVDIAPLVACTLALYGLENPVDVPLSAYERRGLMRL